jgi:predicted nucleic acid-binding protein
MSILLVDTNVVSILFNRNHTLRQVCIDAVAGHQLVISFMIRTELLLWPAANNWGETRLGKDSSRRAGQPIQTADAWIASAARQWGCPLVTTDFGDYAAIDDLDLVPIRHS